jgi:hypothetical protein
MTLLNFSHPLTAAQINAIEQLADQPVKSVIDVKTQFDHNAPFTDQARALIHSIGFSSQDWQTTPLLINLPSLNVVAALVLAELHGRCGYFPAILRLRPVPNTTPPQFEVAEIINLQSIREAARQQRWGANEH